MDFDFEDIVQIIVALVFFVWPVVKRAIQASRGQRAPAPTADADETEAEPGSWRYDRGVGQEGPRQEDADAEPSAALQAFHDASEELAALEAYHRGASLERAEREGGELEELADEDQDLERIEDEDQDLELGEDLERRPGGDAFLEQASSGFTSYETSGEELVAQDEGAQAARAEVATREQVDAALHELEARYATSGDLSAPARAQPRASVSASPHGLTSADLKVASFVRDAAVLQVLLEPNPRNPLLRRRQARLG